MRHAAVCVLTSGLAFTATAGADVIATVPVTFRNFHGLTTPPPTRFLDEIVVSVGALQTLPPPGTPLPSPLPNEVLEQFRVTPADVGKTFTEIASDDPQFLGLKSLLTTGGYFFASVKTFAEGDASGVGASTAGNNKLFTLGPASKFRGYDITSIAYRLDSLTITDDVIPNPSTPHIKGREFAGEVTYIIEGTPVPEPASLGTLALAAATLTLRRRRRAQ
jgi:hypothetical protein